jgi:hypothetical protein
MTLNNTTDILEQSVEQEQEQEQEQVCEILSPDESAPDRFVDCIRLAILLTVLILKAEKLSEVFNSIRRINNYDELRHYIVNDLYGVVLRGCFALDPKKFTALLLPSYGETVDVLSYLLTLMNVRESKWWHSNYEKSGNSSHGSNSAAIKVLETLVEIVHAIVSGEIYRDEGKSLTLWYAGDIYCGGEVVAGDVGIILQFLLQTPCFCPRLCFPFS